MSEAIQLTDLALNKSHMTKWRMFFPHRPARLNFLVPSLFLVLAACSKEQRPSNHPIASIYDRNVTKIELVALVVNDGFRYASAEVSP